MVQKILLCVYGVFVLAGNACAQGAYIEFALTNASKNAAGTTKVYYKNGNTRSVISAAVAQTPVMPNRVSLVLNTNPDKAYVLNEAAKTYTEIDLSKVNKAEADSADFDITVISKEKIGSYNCTHVKMKRKLQPADEDIWLTTDIANYKNYLGMKSKYTAPGLYKALQAKGVAGFPVRMQLNGTANTVTMQVNLVHFEQKPLSDSLFSLKGYTYNDNAPPAALQQMNQKLQQMTPEERLKFLDEMRKKQQQPKDNR